MHILRILGFTVTNMLLRTRTTQINWLESVRDTRYLLFNRPWFLSYPGWLLYHSMVAIYPGFSHYAGLPGAFYSILSALASAHLCEYYIALGLSYLLYTRDACSIALSLLLCSIRAWASLSLFRVQSGTHRALS